MSGYLLDTNVLSELMKKRPSPPVARRVRSLARSEFFTSAVCVMELRFGPARQPRGSSLWERIQAEIRPLVSVLPLRYEEAIRAGEVLAGLEARGTPGLENVLIGWTGLMNGLSVAARNVKHPSRIDGLAAENWWK